MRTGRREFLVSMAGFLACSLLRPTFAFSAGSSRIPRRAIGVNCMDLFYGPLIHDTSARPAEVRMRELGLAGIPFVRFAASPFWPNEWRKYYADRQRYFSHFDAVVKAAETHKIGLVPSLFWNPVTISDLVGEPVSDWGKQYSRTRDFMAGYVKEIVGRYHSSSAIWMWEFGNEFNTYANLPNSLKWWPKVNAERGTPAIRSKRDLITAAECREAFRHFGLEVRKIDQMNFISNGADLPRFDAYNLAHGKSQKDTAGELRAGLTDIVPDPINALSIHLYQKSEGRYFPNSSSSYTEILSEVASAAKGANKLSFVGEFGVPRMTDKAKEKREYERMLKAIAASGINLAALWVFDFQHQKDEWSVQFGGDRAYQLDAVSKINSEL